MPKKTKVQNVVVGKKAVPSMEEFVIQSCPFCGSYPIVETWHGGGPNKHLVGCGSDVCDAAPMVTGETIIEALQKWNHRRCNAKDMIKPAKSK